MKKLLQVIGQRVTQTNAPSKSLEIGPDPSHRNPKDTLVLTWPVHWDFLSDEPDREETDEGRELALA